MTAGSNLAPRHEDAYHSATSVGNPFAAPESQKPVDSPMTQPALPDKCKHPVCHHPSSPEFTLFVDTNPRRKDMPSNPRPEEMVKSSPFSSAGDGVAMTPISSIDLEKGRTPKKHERQSSSRDTRQSKHGRRSQRSSRMYGTEKPDADHPTPRVMDGLDNDAASATFSDGGGDAGRQTQEQHAIKIILFLSGPCVLLSTMNIFWAMIAFFITILAQPVRLCAKRPSFGLQLSGLLGPSLNLQLRCIYTPLPPHANEDSSYHCLMLVVVHLLSPFLSFAVMIVAWVLCVYWASSAIVGDPAGQDKRDDGRESVLWLRDRWERWLMRSIQED